jgi:hypothetical protein
MLQDLRKVDLETPNFSNEANDMINEFIQMYHSLKAHFNVDLSHPITFPKNVKDPKILDA